MKDKIMTPYEFRGKECYQGEGHRSIEDWMRDYAKYYHREMVESVTDEETKEIARNVGGKWTRRIGGAKDGIREFKQELLKRNEL